ncbi:DNA methyltransferase [soil metagenome]
MHQLSITFEEQSQPRRSGVTSASTVGPANSSNGLAVAPTSSAAEAAWERTPVVVHGRARLFQADCLEWLRDQPFNSIHGVVTDPPYGLVEYSSAEQRKLRKGKGGVWRIPPSFDGHERSPLPRFTTLSEADLQQLHQFFNIWARCLLPIMVPGAHVMVACNPLVSYLVSDAIGRAGFERRGEIVRLVMTMRGGDRPKNAHEEFSDVTVMPRSQWEPWVLFRRPIEGRVQDNLRKWGTGGLRRISDQQPFGDVIRSSPTRPAERVLAQHPSLKPQDFLRKVVRAVLPLGEGIVLDPFAGSGSTLAAAEAVGYESIGVEMDPHYVEVARTAIPALRNLDVRP